LTFPYCSDAINARFKNTHNNYQKQFPDWSLAATRKKVIAHFWFRYVLSHYALIIAIPVAVISPFCGSIHFLMQPFF